MSSFLNSVQTYVIEPPVNVVKDTYDAIADTGIWFGKKVTKITNDYLPRHLAIITQVMLHAAPVALCYFLLPLPARFILWAAYNIVHLTNGFKSPILDQSLGISCGIDVVKSLAHYASTQSPLYVAATLISVVLASYHFNKAMN